ncbi:MAG: molybdopterin-synthase adenylyltransferase MoeB [Calditrichaeota bacterium]|nr:MAG: molybdopterin-synthase adenylyltransferase MoeB [Calditrichota bacterium]
MAVEIYFPLELAALAGVPEKLTVNANTVGEAVQQLCRRHPTLAGWFSGKEHSGQPEVGILVRRGGRQLPAAAHMPLETGDTIVISHTGSLTARPAGGEGKLSSEEMQRYSRHLLIPQVGLEGQLKLKQARVLIVGAGGLGSPAALYLAAAGVGTLGLVDSDDVELTNLQRQILHGQSDQGRPKVQSAADRLAQINPHVQLELHPVQLTSENALDILPAYDIVLDGTDNFPTRYLINDACGLLGKPFVYGSIFRFEGQVSVFDARSGPCYRCLHPTPPPPGLVPDCAEGGVLGVLPGIIGSLQALEALKWILGIGRTLLGRLLLFDALEHRFLEMALPRDPSCPLCGKQRRITQLIDYPAFCGLTPDGQKENQTDLISPLELQKLLDSENPPLLIDVREPHEFRIAHLPARLIPLGQLPQRLNELNPNQAIVLYCRTGVRSAQGLQLLKKAGFKQVKHLAGGLHAWARDVDPSMPVY